MVRFPYLVRLARDLLGDPGRLEAAAVAARDAYVSRFTWRGQEENLQRLYNELLASGTEPTHSRHGWGKLIGTTFDVGPAAGSSVHP
jgi:hypothetical protein